MLRRPISTATRPTFFKNKTEGKTANRLLSLMSTIGEASDYMTNMGKKRELRTHWQRVCKLILAKEHLPTVSRARLNSPYSWMPSWMCLRYETTPDPRPE
jgi:hypothetical protein